MGRVKELFAVDTPPPVDTATPVTADDVRNELIHPNLRMAILLRKQLRDIVSDESLSQHAKLTLFDMAWDKQKFFREKSLPAERRSEAYDDVKREYEIKTEPEDDDKIVESLNKLLPRESRNAKVRGEMLLKDYLKDRYSADSGNLLDESGRKVPNTNILDIMLYLVTKKGDEPAGAGQVLRILRERNVPSKLLDWPTKKRKRLTLPLTPTEMKLAAKKLKKATPKMPVPPAVMTRGATMAKLKKEQQGHGGGKWKLHGKTSDANRWKCRSI